MKTRFITAATITAMCLVCSGARAQTASDRGKVEIGGQFVALRLNDFGEGAAGLGGRIAYNFSDHIAVEGVINHFPENPSGNFGETVGLVGLRVGSRFDNVGVFAKLRPGVINLGGGDFELRIKQKTYFALDAGIVVEYYAGRRVVLRLDIGDLIVPFGGASYLGAFGTRRLGTSNNLQTELGVGLRF